MIKIAFLKQLKGMPINIAKILIAHKGYKIAPFIEDVLSLHPPSNTILISEKDGKIIKAKAADIIEVEP